MDGLEWFYRSDLDYFYAHESDTYGWEMKQESGNNAPRIWVRAATREFFVAPGVPKSYDTYINKVGREWYWHSDTDFFFADDVVANGW